ncbi:hypothetical protein LCGC14_1153610 [marine sediment metagenome]|uniref:HNH nuclease domain-containing protein n=1 Tax=marine sediment metagenome TaxID=412755 RepID=A0A0F9MHY9_9ZZZZ
MLRVKLEKPTGLKHCWILLTQGKFAIIDREHLQLVNGFRWVAVKWHRKYYAYSYFRLDGTRSRIAMHRLIAETPQGDFTHHFNHNSLDNRSGNLLNMTNRDHMQLHGVRVWT